MANTDNTGRVSCVTGNILTAGVNTGTLIIPPDSSRSNHHHRGMAPGFGG